jgi:two-component system response regulator RegX3
MERRIMRIAVLENDVLDARLLEEWLQSAGHASRVFASGSEFSREHNRARYDLVIIGSTGADIGGTEITIALREQQEVPVPIIRLLRRARECDVVAALKAGADDCMIQPARQFELLARVDALVRRTQNSYTALEDWLEFGALRVDVKNRLILRDGVRLALTPKTYDLALILLTHTGKLLSRTFLMEHVWGHGKNASTRTLDTHVSRLRAMLGLTPEHGWLLQSVYQHGYRLERIDAAPVVRIAATAKNHERIGAG